MHSAEHRGYRELHAATGQLEKHWCVLAERLSGTPQAPSLREGADAAGALRGELDELIEARDLYGGPASQAAGRSVSFGRNLLSDRFLERNQAARLAVLDAQHVATLCSPTSPASRIRARTRSSPSSASVGRVASSAWRVTRGALRSSSATSLTAPSRGWTRVPWARPLTEWRTPLERSASGPTAACACSGGADQRAHGPVETGRSALPSASRTIESGTPKPTSRSSVAGREDRGDHLSLTVDHRSARVARAHAARMLVMRRGVGPRP